MAICGRKVTKDGKNLTDFQDRSQSGRDNTDIWILGRVISSAWMTAVAKTSTISHCLWLNPVRE